MTDRYLERLLRKIINILLFALITSFLIMAYRGYKTSLNTNIEDNKHQEDSNYDQTISDHSEDQVSYQ